MGLSRITAYRSVVEFHDCDEVDAQDKIFTVRNASREQLASAWMDLGVALFRLCQAVRANTSWRGSPIGCSVGDDQKTKQFNAEEGSRDEENPSANLLAKTRRALRNAILIASNGEDDIISKSKAQFQYEEF